MWRTGWGVGGSLPGPPETRAVNEDTGVAHFAGIIHHVDGFMAAALFLHQRQLRASFHVWHSRPRRHLFGTVTPEPRRGLCVGGGGELFGNDRLLPNPIEVISRAVCPLDRRRFLEFLAIAAPRVLTLPPPTC